MEQITPEMQQMITTTVQEADKMQLTVKTPEDYKLAGDYLRQIKQKIDMLENTRKTVTGPLNLALKTFNDLFKPPVEKLKSIEAKIKLDMGSYYLEQERKRIEQEAKLQEQARVQAEKEKAKLDKKIAKTNDEQTKQTLEMQKDTIIPVSVSVDNQAQAQGISTKKVWKYRIVDSTLIPREYLMPNDKALQGIATATKGTIKIPGIEIYSDNIIVARK